MKELDFNIFLKQFEKNEDKRRKLLQRLYSVLLKGLHKDFTIKSEAAKEDIYYYLGLAIEVSGRAATRIKK